MLEMFFYQLLQVDLSKQGNLFLPMIAFSF
uniref:Uncharacterized protein n=1 Tax=Arundo donax TaxID=35708 RepID=A0A0A9EWJ6_ARUDO